MQYLIGVHHHHIFTSLQSVSMATEAQRRSLAELLLLALSLAELLLAQPLDEPLLVFSAAELLLLVLPLSEA